MSGSKQSIEVQVWAHPSGEPLRTLPKGRTHTGYLLLHGLGSGTQAWVGESIWPAGSRVESEESSQVVSEGEPGVEMQPD